MCIRDRHHTTHIHHVRFQFDVVNVSCVVSTVASPVSPLTTFRMTSPTGCPSSTTSNVSVIVPDSGTVVEEPDSVIVREAISSSRFVTPTTTGSRLSHLGSEDESTSIWMLSD